MSVARGVSKIEVNTEKLPNHEQFAYWREGMLSNTGIVTSREASSREPFGLSAAYIQTKSLLINRMEIRSPCKFSNENSGFAKQDTHFMGLTYRVSGDDQACSYAGADAISRSGDVRLFDMRRQWSYQHEGVTSHTIFLNAHQLFDQLPAGSRVHGRILRNTPLLQVYKKVVKSVFEELQTADDKNAKALSNHVLSLAFDAIKLQITGEPESVEISDGSTLLAVKEFIRRNYSDPELTPKQIASAVALSRSKLYRVCQPHGSPMDMVREFRLQTAARELRSNQVRNVSVIAHKVGFSCRQAFSRSFKERFNISPRDFVREAVPIASFFRSSPGVCSWGGMPNTYTQSNGDVLRT